MYNYCVAEYFKKWLLEAIERLEMTYDEFGQLVGVSHSSVSQWVSGKHLPEPKQVIKIAEITGADEIWLSRMVGYLSPLKEGQGEQPTPEEAEWRSLFVRLSGEDREDLLAMARVKEKRGKGEQREAGGFTERRDPNSSSPSLGRRKTDRKNGND